MSFYGEWLACGNPLEEQLYIKNFLEGTQESSAPLFNGNEEDLDAAYAVIKQTPLTDFFEIIERDCQLPTLNAACVPCFSSLEKSASRVNEILEFEPEGLTFDQLGYQLMNSKKQGAQKKYGENQAKLAMTMNLVYFKKNSYTLVCPTTWGSYLTRYTFEQKQDVLKKLLLRDPCIRTLLHFAFLGPVKYCEIVPFLKKSTMIRRRTNVRSLVLFILNDSEREVAYTNIDWDVEED